MQRKLFEACHVLVLAGACWGILGCGGSSSGPITPATVDPNDTKTIAPAPATPGGGGAPAAGTPGASKAPARKLTVD